MLLFEGLESNEKYGLALGFAVAIVAAFSVGATTSGGSPTGAFAADSGGDASKQQIKQKVQSLMDKQMQRQQQQLKAAANRSENLTMDDLSMDASVDSVSQSQFGSLYKVNISVTGEVPRRLGSGTRSLDQNQVMYISSDGRYLFQQPTDLEQQRQQRPRRPPTRGSSQ